VRIFWDEQFSLSHWQRILLRQTVFRKQRIRSEFALKPLMSGCYVLQIEIDLELAYDFY